MSATRYQGLANPLLLGFDELEQMLTKVSKGGGDGYPPYNIERIGASANGEPERLRITLAVAGFTEGDLEIAVENRELRIEGRQKDDEKREYLHRGIAARQFRKAFVLADGMEVEGAGLENGLLTIDLIRLQPENRVTRISIRKG